MLKLVWLIVTPVSFTPPVTEIESAPLMLYSPCVMA